MITYISYIKTKQTQKPRRSFFSFSFWLHLMQKCFVTFTGSHRVQRGSRRSLRHEQIYIEARVSGWLVVRGPGLQASMARLKHLTSQGPAEGGGGEREGL